MLGSGGNRSYTSSIMARSDSETLDKLLLVRDGLIDGLANGESVVEFEVRGRRARYPDPVATLEWVEKRIGQLKAKTSRGSARVGVRLKR